MRKYRENKQQGFTLVELIVVLVILAILAAILVPALTGYIDKAKQRSIITNGSYALKAAQSLASENYGKDTWEEPADDEIIKLAEVSGDIKTLTFSTHGIVDTTEAKPFQYEEGGMVAQYADGEWSIVEGSLYPAIVNQPLNMSTGMAAQNKELYTFLSTGEWESVTEGNDVIKYKIFEIQGTKYALSVVNDKKGDAAKAIANESGIEKENVCVYTYSDGAVSKDQFLENLSSAIGSNKIIDKITFDKDGNITAVDYKNK